MPKLKPLPVVLSIQQQASNWRKRGETLRSIAGCMQSEDARASLLRQAAKWDAMAKQAETGDTPALVKQPPAAPVLTLPEAPSAWRSGEDT